ncbi:Rieske (2Fe-2S) protein [Gloeocapsa sp. BRSZ]|uniref:QcrA and Rieske domain-containing protein n=1 Tax=Gloeocapsopsis sp. IPPAS B-1203 TaxID=2049454 RepID=UPI000C1A7EB8|nr:Rieske (2Fe-2S) protein [Gloeocapsopsis sp. IPPAS B-1203]PIG91606.1 Rieske (2Fe-2S) protein [Gloeocapsopsis sp. IPPAS B-1203]
MNRRAFFRWIGLGWLTSTLLPILVACGFKRIAANSRSDGFVVVGNVSELDQSAGKLQVQVGNTRLIVVGSASHPQTIVVLNPTCPHAGCIVKWKDNQSQFVCPCHGSEFDSRGQVTQGPATRDLVSYSIKVENQSILVKLN